MLTDIFADRYSTVDLWSTIGKAENRLLVQTFRILSEQICPYFLYDGKENPQGKVFWKDIHDRLSMELGLKSLSPVAYTYQGTRAGKPHTYSGLWTFNKVCENWMLKEYDGSEPTDAFMKERLSLVEIGYRKRGEQITAANDKLPEQIAAAQTRQKTIGEMRVPGSVIVGLTSQNNNLNQDFRDAVEELNARFRQAGSNLNYHNGYIQLANDELALQQIEVPFWKLVDVPKWKNVDTDMKEAVDLRDTNGRDPAFYAARALESTIKIISDEKNWTHGRENGAHNYIDNLASKKATFIKDWESDALKAFFTKLRNPFGHGAGSAAMPALSEQQTDWAIETCMIWIRSLMRRM